MTIKQRGLREWQRRGGVWTRPAANRFYQEICDGSPDYTSLTVGRYLRDNGVLVDHARPGGKGHWVQVWVMGERFWNECV